MATPLKGLFQKRTSENLKINFEVAKKRKKNEKQIFSCSYKKSLFHVEP